MHPMKIEREGKRVTVYVGSADTWHGRNLAVAIVEQCRAMGMAGATASRGVMGFGKHSVIHRAHFLGLSEDLPEKNEIVDRPEESDSRSTLRSCRSPKTKSSSRPTWPHGVIASVRIVKTHRLRGWIQEKSSSIRADSTAMTRFGGSVMTPEPKLGDPPYADGAICRMKL
jgi:PII-like signaling protein